MSSIPSSPSGDRTLVEIGSPQLPSSPMKRSLRNAFTSATTSREERTKRQKTNEDSNSLAAQLKDAQLDVVKNRVAFKLAEVDRNTIRMQLEEKDAAYRKETELRKEAENEVADLRAQIQHMFDLRSIEGPSERALLQEIANQKAGLEEARDENKFLSTQLQNAVAERDQATKACIKYREHRDVLYEELVRLRGTVKLCETLGEVIGKASGYAAEPRKIHAQVNPVIGELEKENLGRK